LHTALRTQLTTIYLEDFFLTSQILDFLNPTRWWIYYYVLRINYEVSVLYRTPVSADVLRRQRWTRRPTLAADLASAVPPLCYTLHFQ
jgi:hypothetical protein